MKMGAYSMSQQIQLEEMEGEVRANQALTAELNALEEEKRRLENMANKLQFGISNSKMVALSDDEEGRPGYTRWPRHAPLVGQLKGMA